MPVTKDDLLSEATAGLVAMLQNGQRAIAIRVTPESLAGGFVLPGSKVDIVFTKKRGDGDSNAQIIMQDMLVLAVDMKNTRDADQQSMLGNTVTLGGQARGLGAAVAGGAVGRPAATVAVAARHREAELQGGHDVGHPAAGSWGRGREGGFDGRGLRRRRHRRDAAHAAEGGEDAGARRRSR